MNQVMTPSRVTTAGEIDKAVARYRALLEKYAPSWSSEAVQHVLGQPELAKEQFELFRARVEAVSKTVFRQSKVGRSRTRQQFIASTGRVQYLEDGVVATMPLGQGDAESIFINLGRSVDCDKLDDELGKLGFELIVDPQGLAAINEDDPAFADDHPNGTQWKDANGNYCYAAFGCWCDKRYVRVRQDDSHWFDYWWFPCRRKEVLSA